MSALLSLDDAIERMLGGVEPLKVVESVEACDALGRVLAQDVAALADVPPWDNSAMDGYAIRCADVLPDLHPLPVRQRIAAGHSGAALEPGSAARIFTGAPLPPGADAVVMQELCEVLDDGQRVKLLEAPKPGTHVRRRGEDMSRGQVVISQGMRLTPQALGVIASAGWARVSVFRPLRVALLCTGDELAMPGEALRPGQIYNSNRSTLMALLQACGAVGMDLGVVPDDLQATREVLRRAAAEHDLLISTGGVSVGEEDHLKAALQAEGELNLWQVAIKPGKPLAFGHVHAAGGRKTPWIGLPGNPVAAFVTFLMAVRPVLSKMQGLAPAQALPAYELVAGFDWPKPDRRREFLRACRKDDGSVDIYHHQGSAVLSSLHWAQGLVDLAPGQVVRQGDRVRFLPFAGAWPGAML